MYSKFKQLELLIEGPEIELDYSYFLVDQCNELKLIEKGISLSKFSEEIIKRDLEMEFRFLTRLNCHKLHYTNLVKS